MARTTLILMLGALIGAVAFHAYYLRLSAHGRCRWDHPLDDKARAACEGTGAVARDTGYGARARKDLDSLIGNVAH